MVISDNIQIEKTPRPFLSTDSPDLSDFCLTKRKICVIRSVRKITFFSLQIEQIYRIIDRSSIKSG